MLLGVSLTAWSAAAIGSRLATSVHALPLVAGADVRDCLYFKTCAFLPIVFVSRGRRAFLLLPWLGIASISVSWTYVRNDLWSCTLLTQYACIPDQRRRVTTLGCYAYSAFEVSRHSQLFSMLDYKTVEADYITLQTVAETTLLLPKPIPGLDYHRKHDTPHKHLLTHLSCGLPLGPTSIAWQKLGPHCLHEVLAEGVYQDLYETGSQDQRVRPGTGNFLCMYTCCHAPRPRTEQAVLNDWQAQGLLRAQARSWTLFHTFNATCGWLVCQVTSILASHI